MCFLVVDVKAAWDDTEMTTTRPAVPSGAPTLPSSVHCASVAASMIALGVLVVAKGSV
jgi:hypothetical protein